MNFKTKSLQILARWILLSGFVPIALLSSGESDAETNDPYFGSRGSWNQAFDDQWWMKRIGLKQFSNRNGNWDFVENKGRKIIVAVIDTGLDYYHPDFSRDRIWLNSKETVNGIDDDGNGYIDDVMGWNFVDNNWNPWDRTGHGTHIAGLIAAVTNNRRGIAGINPNAVIMPLKVLSFVGQGLAHKISQAIYYAVENGARIINLSLGAVGGRKVSQAEKRAIDYARKKNVLVVVAAGNEGKQSAGYGPEKRDNVITVGATGPDDKRAGFSNWGPMVDIAAPGIQILSLRARRTDFTYMAKVKGYKPGTNFVGPKAQYYYASGTSFSAPMVTGVASLILSSRPNLTPAQVKRMILHSARDVSLPGWDHFTGFGLVDAKAALKANPEYFLDARITGMGPVRKNGGIFVQLSGAAVANEFGRAWVEIGKGENPTSWTKASDEIENAVRQGVVGLVSARKLGGSKVWILRLVVEHRNGRRREARVRLQLG